jgi:hypothetical protein
VEGHQLYSGVVVQRTDAVSLMLSFFEPIASFPLCVEGYLVAVFDQRGKVAAPLATTAKFLLRFLCLCPCPLRMPLSAWFWSLCHDPL